MAVAFSCLQNCAYDFSLKQLRYLKLLKQKSLFVPFFACIVQLGLPGHAEEIESYQIRTGTLEIDGRTYIFRSGATVQKFDWLLDSGVPEPGLSGPRGLREVGFRTKAGELYLYGKERKDDVILRMKKEKPNVRIESTVFEGKGGHRVEIKLEGRTPVYRMDITIAGFPVILWSNIPDEKDANKK